MRRYPRFGLQFQWIALILIFLALGIGWGVGKMRRGGAVPNPSAAEEKTSDAGARAAVLYQMNCVLCHGPEGRGDGPSAATLKPAPRDFAARPWRLEMSKESIRRVIQNGIPGTTMPASKNQFSDRDLDQLVEHVYHLATSRPTVIYEPTEQEKLLKETGFVDLRGTDPPPLTIEDAAGKSLPLTEFKGKLVLLHFWGTACVPCIQELPQLKILESTYGPKGFVVVHICTDEDDLATAQKQIEAIVPGLKTYGDSSGLLVPRYEVNTLPTVWLIDPQGKAIGRSSGAKDWSCPPIKQLLEQWLP